MGIKLNNESITSILRTVKPYFRKKLGKNTHKKRSEDWWFYGLAFTREDAVYVFGINLGFFRKEGGDKINKVGMNVLIRTNGELSELRQQYCEFFRTHLKDWINQKEGFYTSERGDEGVELARYRNLDDFSSEKELIDFLKGSIDGFHAIYPRIIENPNHIFDSVVRAAPYWEERIIDFCKKFEK